MPDDTPNNVRHLRPLPPAPPTPPRPPFPTKLEILTRRRQALDLRTAGSSEAAIARLLAADPEVNAHGNAVPGGYGWRNYVKGLPPPDDKVLRRAVAADISKSLAEARELVSQRSEDLLMLELQRLDRVQTAIWNDVMASSHWHVFRWLQLSERRSKLLGWDSEKRVVDTTAELTVNVTAEGPQPDYDAQYLAKMLAAIEEAELAPSEGIEAARRVLPDANVIDVEAIEEPPPAAAEG